MPACIRADGGFDLKNPREFHMDALLKFKAPFYGRSGYIIIRERFNTYRFADCKEKVIELLTRVTRASVETTKIVAAMKARTGLT